MHQGAAKMTARVSLWWPFMARDISTFAKSCLPCETTKPSNPVETIVSHEAAEYPFQFLHMDIGQEQGRYYLITTDQYSNYPHIYDTGQTCTTKQVIAATVEFITHFSIPEIIYSDGGPQFVPVGEFDIFCKEWGIRHILSSPYMPRSNGHAEAAVEQTKKLIQANLCSNGIINRQSCLAGLQVFRNTPRQPTGKSPAELIFGRPIRDSIPMHRESLLPEYRFRQEEKLYNHRQNKMSDIEKQEKGRELPLLRPKTPVRIQDPTSKKWDRTGFIISFGQNSREYLVKSGHRELRRNRHFLKPIEVEAVAPARQPAQAPLRPSTPQSSNFPVEEDWFKPPADEFEGKDVKPENKQSNKMKMKKIKFSTDEQEKPEVINDMKHDIQKGLPDLITGPIETQTPNIRPSQDSGSNKQADRSDQNSGTPSKSKYRPKKPADLSWPNNM